MIFNYIRTSWTDTVDEIEINTIEDLISLYKNIGTYDIILTKVLNYSGKYPHPYTLEVYDDYRE